MAQKINKITITNFKTFAEPFELKLEGKNLLLYGENGSGKSSIYWSIYTHFQSCLKKQDITDAGKYFDATNPQNLRNRYTSPTSDSGIAIEFIDTDTRITKTYTDSRDLINTSTKGDVFMQTTLAQSDFINYKYLYSIFDFRNSQEADIFGIFEREIFATGEFPEALVDIREKNTGLLNMKAWWDYLTKDAITELPRRNGKSFKRSSDEYKAHQKRIDAFNSFLGDYVKLIKKYTNLILAKEFPLPIIIHLEYKPLSFDQPYPDKPRKHNNTLIRPQIILTAELKDAAVYAGNTHIDRPHTFLNEAKLARMALALRMAVIMDKNSGASNRGGQILCIDDMLISLDMSNRLEVIDYLLDTYSADHQIIFLTHDRALYRIMVNKIRSKNADFWWLKKELYCVDPKLTNRHIPSSELLDEQNLLSCAKYFLARHDYPVCANTLRRLLEKLLHELLPDNMQVTKSGDIMDLSSMLDQMKSLFTKYKLTNFLPNLDIYREHILNPLSHDDLRSNIYRGEMMRCIEDVAELEKYKRHIIVDCKEYPELFKMEISGQTVEFEVREVWDYILDPDGVKHYKPIVVIVKSSTIMGISPDSERKLDALHRRMCEKIGLAEEARPEIYSTIYHILDGVCLTSY